MHMHANSSMLRPEEDMVCLSDSWSRSGSASHTSRSLGNRTYGTAKLAQIRRASSECLPATVSNVSTSAPSELMISRLTPRHASRIVGNRAKRKRGSRSHCQGATRIDRTFTPPQSFTTASKMIAGTSDSGESVPSFWLDMTHGVDLPGCLWRYV